MKTLTLRRDSTVEVCKICRYANDDIGCSEHRCPTFTVLTTSDYRKMKSALNLAWKIVTLAASGKDVAKCREIIKKLRGKK